VAASARMKPSAAVRGAMRAGWIVNLLLLAAVAALIAYAVYGPGKQDETPQQAIASLPASEVKRIVVQPRQGTPIELRKQGDSWEMVRPLQARADRGQVARMLDLLSAKSKEKLAATDLQRFDLDSPALQVTFNDTTTIAFGSANPLTQDLYVLSGSAVYLLSDYYRSLIPDRSERLLTHSLLRPDEKPTAFAFPGFRVEQHDGKWQVVPAPAADKDRPSQDEFNRWLEDWRLASSLLTQPASTTTAPEWVEVRLTDGKTLRIGVLKKDGELVLLRPDEKLSFHFSDETRKRLLTPPSAKPAPADAPSAPAAQPR
jgi:hypothetical protein